MHRHSILTASLGLASALAAQGPSVQGFAPLSSFGVPSGVAEIVSATDDGGTLVYSNATAQVIGFVDIADPRHPVDLGSVPVNGEPTSVSVLGRVAVANVWVDLPSVGAPPPAFQPGELVVMDVRNPASPRVLGSVAIGWHPDSVKLTRIGADLVAVVAIENQPVIVENGVVADDDAPGNPNDVGPPGFVQIVTLDLTNVAASHVATVRLPAATLAAAGLDYTTDPQPEFCDVNGTTAAVSLQENNGIAIVDIADPRNPSLVRVFSTGIATDRDADLTEDDDIRFYERYPSDIDGVLHAIPTDGGGNPITPGTRNPDAIAFHPDGTTIFSADEGEIDYTGGRGVSSWTTLGGRAWDDAGMIEGVARMFGHYPEGRSANKGTEMEGVTVATFGDRVFAFFLSERGSFMAVYDVTNARRPRLVQLLPTGLSPEGVVAIPSRGLVVTADEVSGTLSLFEARTTLHEPDATQPALYSMRESWAALSGLAASQWNGLLFSVPDNAMPTRIYGVLTGNAWAQVLPFLDVTINGQQARYDGEGIAVDDSILARRFWWFHGFWIASEGDGSSSPNLLVQVDPFGQVMREIQLPNAIDRAADPALPGFAQPAAGGQRIRSNGFEGVSMSPDGRFLYAVVQRDFSNEFPTGDRFARIARYDLAQLTRANPPCNGLRCGGDWDFFFYRLDSADPDNWAGLSEVSTTRNGDLLILERDKGVGAGSQLKKIYRVSLAGLTPDRDGAPDASDTVRKQPVLDLLDAFFPYEKVEGMTVTPTGDLWVGMDNDGGELESRLVNSGRVRNAR